jgi:hypothetical protein
LVLFSIGKVLNTSYVVLDLEYITYFSRRFFQYR